MVSYSMSKKKLLSLAVMLISQSKVVFTKHAVYFHTQVKCGWFQSYNKNITIYCYMDYYSVETTVILLVCAEFRTDIKLFPATNFNGGESQDGPWVVSFLVNLSLLCSHQFCVVMSEHVTVFHLNIE